MCYSGVYILNPFSTNMNSFSLCFFLCQVDDVHIKNCKVIYNIDFVMLGMREFILIIY